MPEIMMRQAKSMTQAVVEQIAEAEGVAMTEIPPLVESIDPDALEAIFADSAASAQTTLEFNHSGYRITIDGGDVSAQKLVNE